MILNLLYALRIMRVIQKVISGGEHKIDFKIFYEKYGMTTSEISKYFGIPYRTVQDWKLGKRRCAGYLIDLMIYKIENEKNK